MNEVPIMEVRDLTTRFYTDDGTVFAVNGISYNLHEGETLGIVGESGCGKSVHALSIMGLIPSPPGKVVNGTVTFRGRELLSLSHEQMRRIRGSEIAMIFQDPMTSLNPYLRVSEQMAEVLVHHRGLSKRAAIAESVRMLDAVRIPEAQARVSMYPHEFSGGMRQRVMIAMSLLCQPDILIADEPTTALDVTVQAQIMKLLAELQKEFGMAVVLITHDLGVVAGSCEETLVMYGGQVMEHGTTTGIFERPTHPYTMGLLKAVPRLDQETEQLETIPGNPPNMMNMPTGCPFVPRCGFATDACWEIRPVLKRAEGFKTRTRACIRGQEELV
jgi:oligopeptide transport system ATP-binding protein